MAEEEDIPEVYTKFDVKVTYKNGKVKEKSCAVGNGAMTEGQLAKWYQDRGHFRGAKTVEIKGVTALPQEHIIKQQMESRANNKSKFLPKFLGIKKSGSAEELLSPPRDGDVDDTKNVDSVGPAKSPKNK